jgi:ribonuclease P protein component
VSAASAGGRRKRGRLSRSGDFDRVYREGRSHGNRYLVLYAFPRGEVGGAVERNAVKRALKEAFWSVDPQAPPRHDFVLVARPDVAGLLDREGAAGVRTTLESLMVEAGLGGKRLT